MHRTEIAPEDRALLQQVRDRGVLRLATEERAFASARRLEAAGFLRSVSAEAGSGSSFVLSGHGIALVGTPRI